MIESLQAKVIGILLGLIVLFLACLGAYRYGETNGTKVERGLWETREAARTSKAATTALTYAADVTKDVAHDNELERKANERYETAVAELRRIRDANRALIAERGGLRISADACAGRGGIAGKAEAPGTSGGDGAFAGTIALPQSVDADLQDSADEADGILERLRTLQEWVIDQGFYGGSP